MLKVLGAGLIPSGDATRLIGARSDGIAFVEAKTGAPCRSSRPRTERESCPGQPRSANGAPGAPRRRPSSPSRPSARSYPRPRGPRLPAGRPQADLPRVPAPMAVRRLPRQPGGPRGLARHEGRGGGAGRQGRGLRDSGLLPARSRPSPRHVPVLLKAHAARPLHLSSAHPRGAAWDGPRWRTRSARDLGLHPRVRPAEGAERRERGAFRATCAPRGRAVGGCCLWTICPQFERRRARRPSYSCFLPPGRLPRRGPPERPAALPPSPPLTARLDIS